MIIKKEQLAQAYAGYSQEGLLALHATGALTPAAFEALEAEIVRRGLAVPARGEVRLPWRIPTLSDYWQGKVELAYAWVVLLTLGSLYVNIVLSLAEYLILQLMPGDGLLLWLGWRIFAASGRFCFLILALFSVWRCAENAEWTGWRYLARGVGLPLFGCSWLVRTLQAAAALPG